MTKPYAVIELGGKQYHVQEGDELVVDRLSHEKGATLRVAPLLMVSDKMDILLGGSDSPAKEIEISVIDHIVGKKIDVGTFKSKVRYRRRVGFRPRLTKIKVENIGK